MKKPNRLFTLLCCLTLLLAAMAPLAAAETVTLQFWYPEESNQKFYDEVVAEFMAENPDINVVATAIPPVSKDVDTKLNAAKLSGTYPDVFSAYLSFMGSRATKGEFLVLDPYLENWADKNDIFDSVYNMGTYDNKVYALGFYPAPRVMVYRKDYFAEAGIEHPPTNWDELKDYAARLTVKDDQGNIVRAGFDIPAVDSSATFVEPFFRQNGSKLIDMQTLQPDFANEKGAEALQFLVDLKDDIGQIPHGYDKFEEIPFSSGRSAMSMYQIAWINAFKEANPELADQIGVASPLGKETMSAFCGYRLYTIGATSKHPDQAWKLIEFLVSKDVMWKAYQELNIPVVRKSLEQEYIADKPEMNAAVMDAVKYGQGKMAVPWVAVYNQYLAQAVEEAMNHVKTPEQALADQQKALMDEIALIP